MARPTSHWMPMYWSAYLADTRRLSTLEHGAYMLLIGEYWQSGKPLPDDDRVLARIAGLTKAQWLKIKSCIASFFVVEGGLWTHGRVDEELITAQQRYERRSAAGQKGGSAKASQKPSNAVAMLEQSHTQEQGTKDKEDLPKPSQEVLRDVVLSSIPPGAKPYTQAQKREMWQWNICKEALVTMPEHEYQQFSVALMAGEPWARKKANEIDRCMKARKCA